MIRTRFPIRDIGLESQSLRVVCCQGAIPGMMYVNERSADSICDTALLFLVMKSEYMPSSRGGSDSVFCVACLYMVQVAMLMW